MGLRVRQILSLDLDTPKADFTARGNILSRISAINQINQINQINPINPINQIKISMRLLFFYYVRADFFDGLFMI
jgi:hypothetical protein